MVKMIYFDYCAFAIIAVLLLSMIARRLTKGRVNHYFIFVLLISLVTTVADIFAVALDNYGSGNVTAKYLAHTAYLLFHNLTTPFIITYIVALTDTWHKLEAHKGFREILSLPIIAVVIGLTVNFFVPCIFYFDEEDHYTRGGMFFLLYISAVVYILVGAYFVIRYRKAFDIQRYIAIAAIFPLMVSAIIVQMLKPQILVEMFANAIGLLGIALVIQRPEERMDSATGFGNFNAYTSDMKRSFYNKKQTDLIILTITNYQTLWEMMGYEPMERLILQIAAKFENLFYEEKNKTEFYNLGRGNFVAAVSRGDGKKLEEIAEKLVNEMSRVFAFHEIEVNLISNICIAHCPEDIKDVAQLLALGDELHRTVRNGEVLYAKELFLSDKFDMIKKMDQIIERAIAEHKFEVYYQPIFSVKEQRFQSAEALLRLKDEEYGFISPDIFIPAAEKNGAIHRIGSYVLEEVCQFIGSDAFKQLGLDYIEINLSVQQCMQKDLAEEVLAVMEKYHVTADKINLEITETAASYSQNIFLHNVKALEYAGVRFSLDDYGTGYSNMKRIVELPLHIVKIDKTFTAASSDERMRIVLQNTVRMIKDMNMEIVVEGVETQEMVRFFSDLNCEYIQGYFYSKPIPKKEFIHFIEARRAS